MKIISNIAKPSMTDWPQFTEQFWAFVHIWNMVPDSKAKRAHLPGDICQLLVTDISNIFVTYTFDQITSINMNIMSYKYRKSHCGDKTILEPPGQDILYW